MNIQTLAAMQKILLLHRKNVTIPEQLKQIYTKSLELFLY